MGEFAQMLGQFWRMKSVLIFCPHSILFHFSIFISLFSSPENGTKLRRRFFQFSEFKIIKHSKDETFQHEKNLSHSILFQKDSICDNNITGDDYNLPLSWGPSSVLENKKLFFTFDAHRFSALRIFSKKVSSIYSWQSHPASTEMSKGWFDMDYGCR